LSDRIRDKVTLGILIPSGPCWSARFAMSLVGAISYFMLHKVPYCQGSQGFYVINERGSILPQLRQNLVEKALERKETTHVLFIDSDETFPVHAIWRLMSHNLPVVGAAFPVKKLPSHWTVYTKVDGKLAYAPLTGQMPELVRVARIGTGMLLLDVEVFRCLPKPWFPIQYRDGQWVGEDWSFCEMLESAGIPIVCDTRLSLEVGHVGEYEYTLKDIGSDKSGGNSTGS
jgi:hypothetical protein